MKNLIIATCAVLGITALNACSQQEIPDTPAPTAETITVTARTAEEQTGTKTTLSGLETHWVKDVDKIGVFSPEAAGQKNNVPYTAQSNGKSSAFTGSLVWGGAGAHNFYAYYPYNSTYTGDHTAVPFSLPSEQTQSAANNTDHIGALDYMVAIPTTASPPGPVALTFNHVFAMIEFKIIGTGTLKKIRLHGADLLACGGEINLNQNPAPGICYNIDPYIPSYSKYVTVTLTNAAILSMSDTTRVYMMVLSGTQDKNLQIALNFDDGTWKDISKAPPGGKFVRGMKYMVTLNTADPGWKTTFKDFRDDEPYEYVTLGTQTWMKRNLAYLPIISHYTHGSKTAPHYYVYGYVFMDLDVELAKNTHNYRTYGVLYNWPAAMGACPTGWHLPSQAEWIQLKDYLIANGYNYDGTTSNNKIAKSMSATGWNSSGIVGAPGNTNDGYEEVRNKSGFSALPGGRFDLPNKFWQLGSVGNWWSSTMIDADNVWSTGISCAQIEFLCKKSEKGLRYSVRCIRDY